MTGRDLIMYILSNNLENEPVFKDGKFVGFMTVMEAAVKFGVGPSTVRVWYDCGVLDGIKIGETIYIFDSQVALSKGVVNVKSV